INMVGPALDTVIINLSDTDSSPDFTRKWFRVSPEEANKYLAIALTAQTNPDLVLRVYVDIDTTAKYPWIERVYLETPEDEG
ncbi:hypothetical protein ACFL1N_17720, partial [Thermodesulfobacteriota bacterium]